MLDELLNLNKFFREQIKVYTGYSSSVLYRYREVTLDCFFDLEDVERTTFVCTRYKFTLLLYFCFCTTLTDCAPNFYQLSIYGDANDSPDLAAAAAASFKMALATSSEEEPEEKVVSLDGRAANGFDSCTR